MKVLGLGRVVRMRLCIFVFMVCFWWVFGCCEVVVFEWVRGWLISWFVWFSVSDSCCVRGIVWFSFSLLWVLWV